MADQPPPVVDAEVVGHAGGEKRYASPATGAPDGGRAKKMSKQAYAPGKTFMLFRKAAEDGGFEPCEGTDPEHMPDSIVHRFDREVGFVRPNQTAIDADELISSTYAAMRNNREKLAVYSQRVRIFALFERYVQTAHPGHAWVQWLHGLAGAEEHELDVRVSYEMPPTELITTWAQNLRNGMPSLDMPKHKGSSIKTYLGGISGTNSMFNFLGGNDVSCMSQELSECMAEWKDADDVNGAVAFDFAEDLPKLWDAVWTVPGWHQGKRVKVRRSLRPRMHGEMGRVWVRVAFGKGWETHPHPMPATTLLLLERDAA